MLSPPLRARTCSRWVPFSIRRVHTSGRPRRSFQPRAQAEPHSHHTRVHGHTWPWTGDMSRRDRHLSEPHIAHPILDSCPSSSAPGYPHPAFRSIVLFPMHNWRHIPGSPSPTCTPVAAVPLSPSGPGTAIQMTRGSGQIGVQHFIHDIGHMWIMERIQSMGEGMWGSADTERETRDDEMMMMGITGTRV